MIWGHFIWVVLNGYRAVALVLLVAWIIAVVVEAVFLGSPAFWPVWLVGTIVLIAIVILSHEAREEEEDEEETAQEIIRDLDTDHSTRAGSPRPR